VKKKRFAIEQITAILKQAAIGTPAADLCRKFGISEQSFYRWRKTYGGMEPSEACELKQLREENVKLKSYMGRAPPSWRRSARSTIRTAGWPIY
jgi:putative transposase